ncbi:sulfonate ABC transporter substrate-binding protein [Burkholderia cenocepacia]|uniref:sulfonate ABC transporter substrate-binding protein n=1 Tax=Burkholderia cenocepacia TaxID=95486 RepID=UPI0019052E1E|nr:sulfonate ABC transporter substrate-binding protein [Burkholderia cenocepacia]ELW9531109.1 sulfonate ABC transporter substrate-binding protein [Burkholderia cenocepacia]MBJ9896648.1 sulfonate ABC transporter substrate-binding protein [Burkholderia cenocepacia]MBJ9915595.1 sulfonate ABC transporter substrate-binding protein [Burkholderia cenocepacia]MBN3501621.1 sulfonate ABC transporter substrate-binding protein [Burkholderia cenocepacia]MBR8404656.1 sulfonate ABC transporter substrate-bind
MADRHSSIRRRLLHAGLALAAGAAAHPGLALAGAAGTRTLRIGYQKGPLSLLKARGTLQGKLATLGVNITWTEFPSGPPQLEALNAGSIDFGDVGEAPPIFALAAGAPLVYYAQTPAGPTTEAVVVAKDSPVKTFADLRGKRIALVKGSNTHFLLVRLLQAAKLGYADVTPVWLSPSDARAAFENRSVDAWIIWDPFLAVVQQAFGARIVADGTGLVENRSYYFASRTYAQRNADVLDAVVSELTTVQRWLDANRAQGAAEFSKLWGIPEPAVALAFRRARFGVEPVTRDTLAYQQRIADVFYQAGILPKRVDVSVAAPPSLA